MSDVRSQQFSAVASARSARTEQADSRPLAVWHVGTFGVPGPEQRTRAQVTWSSAVLSGDLF